MYRGRGRGSPAHLPRPSPGLYTTHRIGWAGDHLTASIALAGGMTQLVNPPVIEVVLGVQFVTLPKLTSGH